VFVARGVGWHLRQSDLGCQHPPYVEAAERGLQEGLRSIVGYTVKGSTTAKHYPVIDDIVVTLYTKPAVVVQTTRSVYEVTGSADLDCQHSQYAQVAERGLQDGTCSSTGYTVQGATNAKYYSAIGDPVAMLYTKKSSWLP